MKNVLMKNVLMKNVLMKTVCLLILLVCLLPLQLGAQIAAGQTKFLGNIWSAGSQPANFTYYWNQVTPGVSGKWSSCEQVQDDMTYWLWLDRCYNSAQTSNLIFKEHTLVWGNSTPTWVCSLPAAEQAIQVEQWFAAVAERYPNLPYIDVVNEPLHVLPCFKDAIGGSGTTGWDWVIWCFEKARLYFPNSKLILNEYNTIGYPSTTTSYLTIINLLKDRGLIDIIGEQAHGYEAMTTATLKTGLDALGATGLPIHISEYECNLADNTSQLSVFSAQFTLFWTHPSVQGITLWGYIQGDMWRPDAWLVSADASTERPSMKWLREYFGQDPNITPPPTPTPSPTPTPTPSPTPIIVNCTGVAEWSATTIYSSPGMQVVYNNKLYQNNWYTAGDNPETNSGAYAVWTLLGACSGSVTGNPTPTLTPTPAPTVTRTATLIATATRTATVAVTPTRTATSVVTPTRTATSAATATRTSTTVVTATRTATSAVTATRTSTSAVTPTRTATSAVTATRTATATTIAPTPTGTGCTCAAGCSSITAITPNFSKDGIAQVCFSATSLGSYINSWNLVTLNVNGVDCSNKYVAAASLPAQIGGLYYVYYNSTVSYGHFEAMN